MKTILLPIDLYSNSRQILEDALAFLQNVGGHRHICLLKTYSVPVSFSDQVIDTHDKLQNRSLEELQNELKAAKELANDGNTSFESMLQMGKPINVITRLTKERNITCIIIEQSANGTKQEEILHLLNSVPCPIVILPMAK